MDLNEKKSCVQFPPSCCFRLDSVKGDCWNLRDLVLLDKDSGDTLTLLSFLSVLAQTFSRGY